MESTLLGLVLDSSSVIAAERKKESVADFIESIFRVHGTIELSLSPVAVAELVHGIYRSQTLQQAQRRREYIHQLLSLVPVHPFSRETGWMIGEIQGREAAKGNVLPLEDLMIAAAAIEQGYAVLTGNVRHFQRIPGLIVIKHLI